MRRLNSIKSLWIDDVLHLPPSMWRSYSTVLSEYGRLAACAKGTTKKDIHGGLTFDDSIEHFSYRFSNSVSRICYILIDPGNNVGLISSDVLATFGGGRVRVLDLAGGTGAGMVGLLTTISQMRVNGIVPQLPLNVEIVAADISQHALTIYKKMVENAKPFCRDTGIIVDVRTQIWDAGDSSQTSVLCDIFLDQCAGNELFVLVSNLSGVGKVQWAQMTRSFQHVTERINKYVATLLWIEPQGGGATQFLDKVRKGVFDVASWLKLVHSTRVDLKYKWFHEIQLSKNEIEGGMQVMQYIRHGD